MVIVFCIVYDMISHIIVLLVILVLLWKPLIVLEFCIVYEMISRFLIS